MPVMQCYECGVKWRQHLDPWDSATARCFNCQQKAQPLEDARFRKHLDTHKTGFYESVYKSDVDAFVDKFPPPRHYQWERGSVEKACPYPLREQWWHYARLTKCEKLKIVA